MSSAIDMVQGGITGDFSEMKDAIEALEARMADNEQGDQ